MGSDRLLAIFPAEMQSWQLVTSFPQWILYSLEVKPAHYKLHIQPWENHLGSACVPTPTLPSLLTAWLCPLHASGITVGRCIFAKWQISLALCWFPAPWLWCLMDIAGSHTTWDISPVNLVCMPASCSHSFSVLRTTQKRTETFPWDMNSCTEDMSIPSTHLHFV